MIDPCKKLWESCLVRLVLDSLNFVSPTGNYKKEKIYKNAEEWIKTHSFFDICELADKNPSYIKKLHDKIKAKKEITQDQATKYLRLCIITREYK